MKIEAILIHSSKITWSFHWTVWIRFHDDDDDDDDDDESLLSKLTGTTGGEESARMQTFSMVFGKYLS
jgi:hypothetical protein